MSSDIADEIIRELSKENPVIGAKGQTYNDLKPPNYDLARTFFGTMAKVIVNGSSAQYRTVSVYDASEKRSDPSQFHVQNFIEESEFHGGTFSDFERNKTIVSKIPVWDENVNPPELLELRDGYRVIVKDPIVKKTSLIIPSIMPLDKNSITDVPDNYDHPNPGDFYKLNQENGEVQFYFENTGAYEISYLVWNGDINKDISPTAMTSEII